MAQWFMHVTSYSEGDNLKSLSRAQHKFWVTLDCLSAVSPGSLPMKALGTDQLENPACTLVHAISCWSRNLRKPYGETRLWSLKFQWHWHDVRPRPSSVSQKGVSHLADVQLVPELRHCTDTIQTRNLHIICIIKIFGPHQTQHVCQLL